MPRLPHDKAKALKPVIEGILEKLYTQPGGPFQIGQDTWPMGMPGHEYSVTARSFVNAARSLREVFETACRQYAGCECLVFGNESYTFAEVWRRAHAIGHELAHRYGIQKGDRVGIAMRNYPEWPICFLGAVSIGAVAVAVNSLWTEKELAYAINDSGCKVMFLDGKRLKYVDRAISQGLVDRPPVNVGVRLEMDGMTRRDLSGDFVDYAVFEARGKGGYAPNRLCAPNDYVNMMYTSGTTGHPKGVVLTNRGMINQIVMLQSINAAKAVIAKKFGIPGLPYQDAMICPVPLFHITGLNHILISCMANGKKTILMNKWDAGVALKMIHKYKPTSWTGVPTMVQDIMEHPDFHKYDISSLGTFGGGGAPTPASQVKKVYQKTQADALNGYGLTETNGAMALLAGPDYMRKPTSTGPAFPFMDAAIVDPETGRMLPQGATGEIVIKGGLVMSHYWKKPRKTAESLITIPGHGPGWFRSGDIGKIDEEGFIYITDRSKDLIIRGGENISCAEVESAVFDVCDEVMECAAFAIKHARLGEVVGLLVMLKPGSYERNRGEKIASALKGKIAKYKIPKPQNVFFTDKPLPRGATGKILKRVIREKVNNALERKMRPKL